MGNNSMNTDKKINRTLADKFLLEVNKLASQFAWPARSLHRGTEVALVALTQNDDAFERFVWVYDSERNMLKGMLVYKEPIPSKSLNAILELCARINEGLPFGCLEYSFGERALVFRDSIDLDWSPLDKAVGATTSRVLNLGRRYAEAIRLTLQGKKPEFAVVEAEKNGIGAT
jgi:hypothetical protein